MRKPDIRINSRMQVLMPICIFVVVVIVALLMIIPTTGDGNSLKNAEKQTSEKKAFSEDEIIVIAGKNNVSENSDPMVTVVINAYYQATTSGDEKAYKNLFDEPDKINAPGAMSSIIEGYENIRIYTAPGLREGEKAAFVYSDVKFNNIDTLAPSVDSFYLVTDENDDTKLDASMYSDPEVIAYLTLLAEKDPVRSIMENTEYWLETMLSNDDELRELYENMQEQIQASEK